MGSRAATLAVLLGILLVESVALYPGVFLRGEVLSSSALGYGMAPWKGHQPATARPLRGNPVLSDDMALFTPWDEEARAALASGAAPLWNPTAGCGMPLLANNQSAVLAPTQVLRFVWNSPRARTVGVLLKVILAGLGMFLLLGRWQLPSEAALLGGLAWANSAVLTLWLLYPLAEVAAWFPWLVLGLSRALGVGGPPRPSGAAETALAGAAMLLAGHLPTAVQLLVAVVAGTVVLALLRPEVRRRLPLAAAACAAAVLLAAPQVLPTAGYALRSHAASARGGGVPSGAQHLPVEAVWSWLVPRGFGSPERDGYRGPVNFNEATASVGITPLFLALLGLALAPARRERILLGAAAVAAAAAYGLPPLPWLLAHIPLIRLAAGQRWLIVSQWGLTALAAVGLVKLGGAPRARLLLAAGGIGATLLLFVSLHPALRAPADGVSSALAARAVLTSAAEIVAAVSAVALAAFGLRRAAVAILLVLTVGGGALLAWGFNPAIPPEAIPGPTEQTRLVERLREGGRVLPVGWVLRPNTGVLAGLPTVTGVDDLVPERYVQFAERAQLSALDAARPLELRTTSLIRRAAATVVLADRPIAGTGLEPVPELQGPSLWAAIVRGAHPPAAWYPAALPVRGAEEAFAALSKDRLVDENTVVVEGPRPWLPSSPGLAQRLIAVRHGPNRVSVEVSQPRAGIFVLRELADPGWRASVDGAPARIVTADGMFLGVVLTSGLHRVVLDYWPFEWSLGLGLAVLGVLCLLPLVLLGARQRPPVPGRAVVSSPHGVPPENRSGR
ncbi:MAG TPA: YfhO family protein [Thermoanaerobaculaceae bacterium]|nr:YfhO family protein [Thermoanaerobaculaceae bacterium]